MRLCRGGQGTAYEPPRRRVAPHGVPGARPGTLSTRDTLRWSARLSQATLERGPAPGRAVRCPVGTLARSVARAARRVANEKCLYRTLLQQRLILHRYDEQEGTSTRVTLTAHQDARGTCADPRWHISYTHAGRDSSASRHTPPAPHPTRLSILFALCASDEKDER